MEPTPSRSPQPDAPQPRRRGAAAKAKRKAAAAASSSSPSPPPKRQARERSPFDLPPLPPPHHRPLTRQSPLKPARKDAPRASYILLDGEDDPPRAQEAATLPPVDQEFDAVRSRGAGVHVVPTFAGWFSWRDIHPVEKQTLVSFFNGKSERRTPDIYLGIRNFIMKKFHANPQVHLESKDLSELSNGEMDARLEVLEFLSHWGLVNFHPFPPAEQEGSKPVDSKSNADTEDKTSVIEKLFQFETVQSYLVPVPNEAEVSAPGQVPSLLSEPTLAEDLITAAESSVEYHCNSCSVDCSRKRYHCRTQADFDLCCDCYNEGKFDAGMSQSDFILMESAEVPGSGGTSWTDQETLLLLEALEIFKAKWGDIAEHVATKSKAQCMLHFLQMPILDSFLDGPDVYQTSQETAEQVSAEKGTSPDKMEAKDKAEGIETTDEKTSEKTNANCAETETELADNNVVGNKDTKISGDINVVASSNAGESDKSSDPDPAKKETSADDIPGKVASNVIIDVLKSAFEAVGHIPEKEDMGSFAEAGNPVMALAAFLAGLVEHDDAITSCCSSLRAISEISPALQLATRHCFILQDPPIDLEDLPVSVSRANTGGEQQEDEDATPNPNDTDKNSNEKEVAVSVEKQNTTSTSLKDDQGSNRKEESSDEASQVEAKSNSSKDSGNPIAQVEKGGASDNTRDGRNSTSHPVTLNDTNEPSSLASQEAGEESTKDTTDPEWVEGDKPNSEESPTDDLPLKGKVELNKIEHGVAASSTVQYESNQTSSETGNIEEPNSNSNFAADNDSLKRLQRAAATAISAAAVKAKLLAEQEEDQIRRLAAIVIEKQFQKMQAKMSFFTEIENLILRVREHTEKTRKKLLMERSAIIAARMATMPSRPNQPGAGAPGIRLPVGYGVNQQLRRP